MQLPCTQPSPVVHALPSEHALVSSTTKRHPATASQLSSVHGLLSLQLRLPEPTHDPLLLHASVVVHRLPSVHEAPASVADPGLLQPPVPVLHTSSVHGLLSLHDVVDTNVHAPP